MLLTFIATALTYVADRALVLNERNRVRLAPHVKAHLSVLLALAMVAKAGDYMIQTWSLDYSTRGVVFGASYTDVHASLPVLHFLAIVSLVAAAIFLVNIRYKGWRLPAIAIAVMFLTWAFAGKAYPAIIQQYRVSPNEITAETPVHRQQHRGHPLGLRAGQDRERLRPGGHGPHRRRRQGQLEPTLDNVRLWEPRPALDTYSQIQEIRLYYSFTDVDVDRYTIDGKYRQVLISARELDQTQLQPQSQTWVNQHLTYTHGYGFVLSPVNEAGGDGLPVLLVKDIPPRTDTDLKITRPEIYYGELGNDYVVVKTTSPEFDYPKGDTNVYATYAGDGGVPIGSWIAAAGLQLPLRDGQDPLLQLAHRRLAHHVSAAPSRSGCRPSRRSSSTTKTPTWCCATTARSSGCGTPTPPPAASPTRSRTANGTNYMRNPVKVVIDAYDGKVTFYQIDASDPLANAWGKVFPGLFTPGDQMPADLREHMRYPEDIFSVQADMLATYHMTDPQIFYNKEDVWEIPTEIYGTEERPRWCPTTRSLALPGRDADRVRPAAAVHAAQQAEHGLAAGGPPGRRELRQAR